jgi:hypothetical protein
MYGGIPKEKHACNVTLQAGFSKQMRDVQESSIKGPIKRVKKGIKGK